MWDKLTPKYQKTCLKGMRKELVSWFDISENQAPKPRKPKQRKMWGSCTRKDWLFIAVRSRRNPIPKEDPMDWFTDSSVPALTPKQYGNWKNCYLDIYQRCFWIKALLQPELPSVSLLSWTCFFETAGVLCVLERGLCGGVCLFVCFLGGES